MNVPLKKRHNYGKLNGSTSSVNGSNAKQNSNNEDSDQLSCIEVDSSSHEDLQTTMRTLSNSLLQSQVNKADRVSRSQRRYSINPQKSLAGDTNGVGESTDLSASSSVLISSSASDHDPASDQEDPKTETLATSDSDDSDSSSSTKSESDTSQAQYYRRLLTEESVKTHEYYFPPMSTYDRISYWKLADEFSEIEDDFDDATYASKPIRSERLQKRMYKRPPSTIMSVATRKSKKDDKSRKTDEPSPTKKPKIDEKPAKSVKSVATKSPEKPKRNVWKNLQPPKQTASQPIKSAVQPINNFIQVPKQIEQRAPEDIPSTIKFRISYNKTSPSTATATPTRLNNLNNSRTTILDTSLNRSCHNCSLNGSMLTPLGKIPNHNREEFYKYLGIDTNPSPEKTSPEPCTSDGTQHRRSLRVFIQQKQMESITKSREELSKASNNEKTLNSSQKRSSKSMINVPNNQQNISPKSLNVISSTTSNIMQRRSYEPTTSSPPKFNGQMMKNLNDSTPSIVMNGHYDETEIEQNLTCDTKIGQQLKRSKSMANLNVNANEKSADSRVVRIVRRRRSTLLPSPMMLDEIFKRYQRCFQKGYVMRNQLHNRQFVKKVRRQTETRTDTNETAATVPNNDCDVNVNAFDKSIGNSHENHLNMNSHNLNDSIDNEMVGVQTNGIAQIQPTISIEKLNSMEWHHDQANALDKSKIQNPLNPKNGCIHTILTHSRAPHLDDILVVVQENAISFWQVTSRVLCMFGLTRAWMPIGEIERVSHGDTEIPSLYQHRLINFGSDFPAYVELRVRESEGNEFRQCCLNFSYLNVYFVKSNENGRPFVARETINLDTIKGFASSIKYIALKNSPSILMTWTERNVNNQTRCGIVKYTMQTPNFDKIIDIFDYSYLQHDINTLYELNDYHIVGCGDRTIAMWDHHTGNLLIDFEIDLPTIGRNIGCFSIGVERPEYMLLIQLTSSEENPGKENVLKVMAVQTVDPYNWRTLQTHDIPSGFGRIQSIFDNDNMLIISFTSGSFLLLNILSPHTIYVRNIIWQENQLLRNALNGVTASSSTKKDIHDIKQLNLNQLFPQPNGQMIDICDNYVMTKSIWEYFVEK